jgi:hypothetical protein
MVCLSGDGHRACLILAIMRSNRQAMVSMIRHAASPVCRCNALEYTAGSQVQQATVAQPMLLAG